MSDDMADGDYESFVALIGGYGKNQYNQTALNYKNAFNELNGYGKQVLESFQKSDPDMEPVLKKWIAHEEELFKKGMLDQYAKRVVPKEGQEKLVEFERTSTFDYDTFLKYDVDFPKYTPEQKEAITSLYYIVEGYPQQVADDANGICRIYKKLGEIANDKDGPEKLKSTADRLRQEIWNIFESSTTLENLVSSLKQMLTKMGNAGMALGEFLAQKGTYDDAASKGIGDIEAFFAGFVKFAESPLGYSSKFVKHHTGAPGKETPPPGWPDYEEKKTEIGNDISKIPVNPPALKDPEKWKNENKAVTGKKPAGKGKGEAEISESEKKFDLSPLSKLYAKDVPKSLNVIKMEDIKEGTDIEYKYVETPTGLGICAARWEGPDKNQKGTMLGLFATLACGLFAIDINKAYNEIERAIERDKSNAANDAVKEAYVYRLDKKTGKYLVDETGKLKPIKPKNPNIILRGDIPIFPAKYIIQLEETLNKLHERYPGEGEVPKIKEVTIGGEVYKYLDYETSPQGIKSRTMQESPIERQKIELNKGNKTPIQQLVPTKIEENTGVKEDKKENPKTFLPPGQKKTTVRRG